MKTKLLKIISIFAAALTVLTLAACGGTSAVPGYMG